MLNRFSVVDWQSDEGGLLLSAAGTCVFLASALLVSAPQWHRLLLLLAFGQSGVVLIAALRLSKLLRAPRANDVDSLPVTPRG